MTLDSQGKFKVAREDFKNLWDHYDSIEHRFTEMAIIFGIHCADFSPEISGFNLCICYLLVEWLRPILLAAIVVFIEEDLPQILAIAALQHVYYLVQLKMINVLGRQKALFTFIDLHFFLAIYYI